MICGLLSLLLGAPPALALGPGDPADPWGRPQDLRAVPAPPPSWAELDADRAVRLWWTPPAGAGDHIVAARLGGRWRVLSEAARPGFTTPPLPPGTGLRVRAPGAARWSEVVGEDHLVDAEALAVLAGPPGAARARTVGQVVRVAETGEILASTLGGGLLRLPEDTDLDGVEILGSWEGLPSARVLAVDARGGEILAGTEAGAWWTDGEVQELACAALPSAHVQAVLLHPAGRFLGTDAGLVRWREGSLAPLLRPWAVYSLAADAEGGLLVGYEGWLRLDPAAPALGPAPRAERPGVDPTPHDPASDLLGRQPGLDFYELLDDDGALLGAAWQRGPLRLSDGAAPELLLPLDRALGLTRDPDGRLWVAAGEAGLHASDGPARTWPWAGTAGVVWDVVASPSGRLWVATDRGLGSLGPERGGAWPATMLAVSAWPTDLPVWTGVVDDDGAWLGGPEGLRRLGGPVAGQDQLLGSIQGEVLALEADGAGGLWVVRPDLLLHLDARGRVESVPLRSEALAATRSGEHLLLSSAEGIHFALHGPLQLETLPLATQPQAASALAAQDGVTWAVHGGRLLRHEGRQSRGLGASAPVRAISASAEGLCVGTAAGLEWLGESGQLVEVPLGRRAEVLAVGAAPGDRCWYATAEGEVGLASPERVIWRTSLSLRESAPRSLRVDEAGGAWVFSEGGSARVQLPAP